MRCHFFLVPGTFLLLVATSAHAAPVMFVDVPSTANTTIFRDYNGTSDSNLAYNPGPASNFPTQAVGSGVSQWTYSTTVGDPKLIYNDGAGTYDNTLFPYVRLRYKQSDTAGGNVQVWENPAQGGEGPSFGASTGFTEGHADPNTTVSPPLTSDGTGYRIDPFSTAAAGRSLTLDYVMIDRFETRGLGEWDADGDFNGWSRANIVGESVADSLLSATGNGDVRLDGSPSFDADLYKFVEIRMKTNSSTPNESQLFWALGGAYNEPQSIHFNAGADQFHTYLLDFTGEPTWTGANMRIRLDPVQGTESFAVDYVRIRAGAIIPEPSTLSLLLAGGMGLIALRRRRRR